MVEIRLKYCGNRILDTGRSWIFMDIGGRENIFRNYPALKGRNTIA
jgi:hypothetical protein